MIMGDLNDDPRMRKSCAVSARRTQRHKRPAGSPHGFYNPFWRVLDRSIGTLAYKSQWNLFDQIIISGNLVQATIDTRWHFFRAKVLNMDFLKDTEGNRQGYPKRTYSAGSYHRRILRPLPHRDIPAPVYRSKGITTESENLKHNSRAHEKTFTHTRWHCISTNSPHYQREWYRP